MKSSSISLHEPAASNIPPAELERFQDKRTKQKIDKHLNDINDTITEEDIRNVDTNVTVDLLNKDAE